MALRLNPPPGWPVPDGFVPPPDWAPDPAWPPAPEGWPLWVDEAERVPATAPADAQPAARRRLSGYALASLILGALGLAVVSSLLGIALGIVGLRRTRSRQLAGRGMAITGIVLSCGWLCFLGVLFASAVAGTGLTGTPAGSGTAPSAPGRSGASVSVFSLRAGDCFDNPVTGAGQNVGSVRQLACTVAHNAEVYATFRLSGSALSYPGTGRLQTLAARGCRQREAGGLDQALVGSAMTIRYLYPRQASWLTGQRTVSCMVVSATPSLKRSLLRGRAS